MEARMYRVREARVSGSRFTEAIERFQHRGPGGDAALERDEPELAQALSTIPPGDTRMFVGIPVTRQVNGDWCVMSDPNLASPWVALQSLQSVLNLR